MTCPTTPLPTGEAPGTYPLPHGGHRLEHPLNPTEPPRCCLTPFTIPTVRLDGLLDPAEGRHVIRFAIDRLRSIKGHQLAQFRSTHPKSPTLHSPPDTMATTMTIEELDKTVRSFYEDRGPAVSSSASLSDHELTYTSLI